MMSKVVVSLTSTERLLLPAQFHVILFHLCPGQTVQSALSSTPSQQHAHPPLPSKKKVLRESRGLGGGEGARRPAFLCLTNAA